MSTTKATILTPVYNDWDSFLQLMDELDRCAAGFGHLDITVLAVDDGSTHPCSFDGEARGGYRYIRKISILHLARNLGHQKAIAIGIAYINANVPCDLVIVMDADGEDQPVDIAPLMEAGARSPDSIIFARRARRSEGLTFRIFYFLYKVFFKLLTGRGIAFGNFALIPGGLLNRISHLPEIWNHFAAGLIRANIPLSSVPTRRGKRYSGKSGMDFISLVIHGLSAISVYIEILTVRLMLLAIAVIVLGIASFFVLLYVRYLTDLAIPGWATNVAIGIVVIMFQAVLLLALLTFLSLNYRSSKLFIPAKDYQDYLLDLEKIYAS